MTERDEYLRRMKERLERVKAELTELRRGGDPRECDELAREHERVAGDFEEVQRASSDAWLALGQRTERDVDTLGARIASARERRGPGSAGH